MKLRWVWVFAVVLAFGFSRPLWAEYTYVQSMSVGEEIHWGLTQWTGNAASLEGAVTGAPDYVYDPDTGTQTGDALGYQQGWGNFVLDFGQEFSGDGVNITFWHFGGFNHDMPAVANNLVYMYVSTDGTTWTPAHTGFEAGNTDGYGSRPRGTAGAVQLDDVLPDGTSLYETTYNLQATFGVDAFRYLMIEKIDGGPKTGKFLDAVGVEANAAAPDYWGGVSAPDWSANVYFTSQTWTFDEVPAWTDTDLDSDGDNDILVVDDGYTAERLINAYGDAVFTGTYYGDSFAWDHIDEGPMDQTWDGVQGMIGGMGSGSLDFYIPNADQSGTCQLWLQYVIFIPNGSDAASVSAQLATDAEFASPIGTMKVHSGKQIHALDDAGATGDWWRVTEQWEVDGVPAGQYLRIITADADLGTANMVDSVGLRTRVIDDTPPAVMGTAPAAAAVDVVQDAAIAITFSKGMHTNHTEVAFSLDPAVSGGFTWSDQDRVMTFTPDADLAAHTRYTVTIDTGAQDRAGHGLDQALSFSFTTRAAAATNQAPDMASPDAQSVAAGSVLRLTLQASDPDNDTLTFSYTADPALTGASFAAASGELVWTPPTDAEGVYMVTFTVSDDGNPVMSDTETLRLTVTAPAANQAPELTAVDDQNVTVESELRLSLQCSDPDGDTLTYGYAADPTLEGASFDTATGELVWTPPSGAEGTYTVTFTVSDDGDPVATDSETISVTVATKSGDGDGSSGGGGGGGCFVGGLVATSR
jgi:hypothetical protein